MLTSIVFKNINTCLKHIGNYSVPKCEQLYFTEVLANKFLNVLESTDFKNVSQYNFLKCPQLYFSKNISNGNLKKC